VGNLLACVAFVLLCSVARADDPFDPEGPLGAALTSAETFFGVVVALAILVTGFFLGRRWLRRVG